MTDQRRENATVATGLLTQAEFDSLNATDKQAVESETRRLRDRYGDAWLKEQQPRLREELSSFYGV